MSPTDVPDLTDDAVERALRADGERWRTSHPAPSLDDAVRRLVAAEPRPARPNHGWWRPVGVAAAVLLFTGGVVGIALGRNPTPMSTVPSSTVTSIGGDAAVAATLTGLPPGFVEVSGHVPVPADASQGPGPGTRRPVVLRSWVGARTISVSPTSSPVQESFVLSALGSAVSLRSSSHTVRGSAAEVDENEWPSSGPDHATIISVLWNVDGRALRLVYTGPATPGGLGGALSVQQVLAVAASYRTAAPDVPGMETRTVPGSLISGSTTLVVNGLSSVRARPGSDDSHLLVTLPGVTAKRPDLASGCEPYAAAFVTGASLTSVTIAVVRYAPQVSESTVCFQAGGRADREVSVDLGAARGARVVLDASTGSRVTLSTR
ncbi:hypothetical protein [Lapillicoccus jejuensis]|uniref:Uncharacterized protein n=1 Tax=Lapillicoccus jejuensis TaxID=402171 RepID=A0A542DZV3_9MICO|nr:hypothetical protein [Lapillicoccus jejuensis]TQJ08641.1 hypothetical protein FB458_1732 [Lapillicoccus jejuensis]